MSTALYNRYRPATFAQVVGQEHVTDALRQALRTGRLHHAYLFSGPRGCGKTSSARILAASLNCVHGPTPEPCGVCDECVSIRTGSSMDVTEIDAASHGLVDDARDLRERAFFAPASARFKVFVVDEAHMVTAAAFNALLKVVEEPPPYLKFVFATTEPDKVIATIRSRTHHYAFRLVPPGTLRDHLASVCEQEGVPVEPSVLPLVVRAGAGSVRDSLSVLDQLLAGAGDDGLRYERAVALLGVTDGVLLDDTVDALSRRDGAALFTVVDRVVSAGHDPRRFATDLLDRFRDLIVMAAVPDAEARGLLESFSPDQIERMKAQAGQVGPAELSRTADILHAGLMEMRGTTSPRLMLELMLARALLPAASADPAALLTRLERLERGPVLGALADDAQWPAPGPAASEHGRPANPASPAVPASPATPGRPPSTGPSPNAGRPPEAAVASAAGPAVSRPAQPGSALPPQPGGFPPAAQFAPPARPAGGPDRPGAGMPGGQGPGGPAMPGTVGMPGAAGGSSGIDAAGLRMLWDEILVLAGRRSRKTHAILKDHASVADVRGDEVVLAFATPTMGRMFGQGNNAELFCAALTERLGGTWRVTVAPAGGSGGGGFGGGFGGRSGPGGGGFPGSPGTSGGAGRTNQDYRAGGQRPAGPAGPSDSDAGSPSPAGFADAGAPSQPATSSGPATGQAGHTGYASYTGNTGTGNTGQDDYVGHTGQQSHTGQHGHTGQATYTASGAGRPDGYRPGDGRQHDDGHQYGDGAGNTRMDQGSSHTGPAPGSGGATRPDGGAGAGWSARTDHAGDGRTPKPQSTPAPAPASAVGIATAARPSAPGASSPAGTPGASGTPGTSGAPGTRGVPGQSGPGAFGGSHFPGLSGNHRNPGPYGGTNGPAPDAPSLDDEDAPSHLNGARGGEEAAMSLLRDGLGATIIEQSPAG